jgi:hypothetical protein
MDASLYRPAAGATPLLETFRSRPRLRSDPFGFRYEFICIVECQRPATAIGDINDKIVGSADDGWERQGLALEPQSTRQRPPSTFRVRLD